MTSDIEPDRDVFLILGRADYPTNLVLRHVLGAGAIEMARPGDGPTRFLKSVRDYRRRIGRGAVVVVAYPAHRAAVCARLATFGRRVAVISAPLVLLYDSRIGDRHEVSRWSWRAALYRIADLMLSLASTTVVADTPSHALVMERRLRRAVRSIPIGSVAELVSIELLGQAPPPFVNELRCVHYGNGFPIQGLETVIAAARLLPDSVTFEIIGRSSPANPSCRNVTFIDPLPIDRLMERLSAAHVVIGQFGRTPQQGRVIPTKVYDALALGRPVVTGENRELRNLSSRALCLIEPGDPDALVAALLDMKRRAERGDLEELCVHAHQTYVEKLAISRVRERWDEEIERTGRQVVRRSWLRRLATNRLPGRQDDG